MQRNIQFTFRVSSSERLAIAELAIWLQRSQSDAVRYLVAEAMRQLSHGNASGLTSHVAESDEGACNSAAAPAQSVAARLRPDKQGRHNQR